MHVLSTDESNICFEGGAALPLIISKPFLHFILQNVLRDGEGEERCRTKLAGSGRYQEIHASSLDWSGQFPTHQPHLKIEPSVSPRKHRSSLPIFDEASSVTAAGARGLLSSRARAGLLCSSAFGSRPPAVPASLPPAQQTTSSAPPSSFRSARSKHRQSPHPLEGNRVGYASITTVYTQDTCE